MLARPPCLTSTTLDELGGTFKRQRTAIALAPAAPGITWEDGLWETVAASTGLTEKGINNQEGLQAIFTRLLKTAPRSTPFMLHDVHLHHSVCGDDLKPDFVMTLRNKPIVPMTAGFVLDLKRHDSLYESNANVGKAIIYGRLLLEQLPRSLRSSVLVGLTDLHTITLIRVTLSKGEDGPPLSAQVSHAQPNVKQVLLQLLSSRPSDIYVELPNLGPSVEIIDFLGHGATSNVYKALKDGQQVWHIQRLAAAALHHVHFICFLSTGSSKIQDQQATRHQGCCPQHTARGVAGVPCLACSSCLHNSIITTTVLEPVTSRTISERNLHNSFPALVQTLKVS